MRLSQQKRDKIAEQILSFLYHEFPNSHFTSKISQEIARDEEFVKALMLNLKDKGLVISIKKNPKGEFYSRRIRWRLSNKAQEAYSKHI